MKKAMAMILALVLVLVMVGCTVAEAPKDVDKETEAPKIATITVTVVHKDGSSKDFTYETDEEYVGPVLVQDGLIEGDDGPYGLEITKVDGEQAIYETDKAYWAVYEGEEYALQGIDTTPVVDGATYKLVYTLA